MAPSHNLHQSLLIFGKVQWHLSEGNFTVTSQLSVTKFSLKITFLKFHSNIPGANEINWGPVAQKHVSLAWISNHISVFVGVNYLSMSYTPAINTQVINTLRPRQNEQHFADDIFKRIFFNENVWILIKISLKFVHKGPIYSIPALVKLMAWRRSGDKPLPEPMMVSLPTHICVTRPQ